MSNDLSSIEQLISDELRAQVGAAVPQPDAWDRFVEYIEGPGTRMLGVDSGEWEPYEGPDDDLVIEFLVHRNETEPPARQKRRSSAVVAVAAAVLIVVGAVVVADRNDSNVETVAVSSATTPDPVPSPTPPPSVVDSGYRWSRVHYSETVFGDGFRSVMYSVIVGGPGLVAVGSDGTGGAVWTSVDGIAWSRVSDDEAVFERTSVGVHGAHMVSVAAGGPGLVAVGGEGKPVPTSLYGESDAWVWTSADGLRWSRVPHDEAIFGGAEMTSVTAGGPGLVAVGWDGEPEGGQGDAAVWTSVDGLTWTRVPHDDEIFGGAEMTSVTAGGPGLVAVGSAYDDAPVWTSVDGITWSQVPHDKAVFGREAGMESVTVGGPGLVAVGSAYGGTAVWTSVDGIAWSRVPHDEEIFGGEGRRMWEVSAGAEGLVAVGRDSGGDGPDAAVWTSVDGITWSRVPHNEAVFGAVRSTRLLEMRSVVAGGPGLVAVGSDAAVWVAAFED